MAQCPWKIHWGASLDSIAQCSRQEHVPAEIPLEVMYRDEYQHTGLTGIMPGQTVTWSAGDRREFTGEWPGFCAKMAYGECILHHNHHGKCTS